MSQKVLHPRVSIGPDTASAKALIERAATVGTMVLLTDLYKSNPIFQGVLDDFIASGVVYAAADKKVSDLEALLAQGRNERDLAKKACQDSHGAAVKQVEKNSTTAADVTACGFVFLDVQPAGIVPPSAILWKQDLAKGLINLHVKYASKGDHNCVIEISPDPITGESWIRLEGGGVKRTLAGYGPGMWWIRAATSLAAKHSAWFGPVAILVK